MNLVGVDGKGESVWLGFFLYEVLMRFTEVARTHGDVLSPSVAEGGGGLRRNLEKHGWDGEWYRRAYFDDGSPLGSSSNPECQIDSIAQSWSVLSVREIMSDHAWPWKRWISASFAASMD
jgi:cyclic beta-1,2-glucan synthetase